MEKHRKIIDFVKSQFPDQEIISLHEPKFSGREKEYVLDTINSTFVSSVGSYVKDF
jgi:dTDP-4-amino-4,6-dideoxygalactose transaminase